MAQRTVCILGGTGFVGARLCARLTRDGHNVRVITRRRERHRDLLVLPGLRLVEGDPFDPATLERELAGCDAAVNLVGILNERGGDGSGFRRAHVELPARLVEACRAAGVPRLLHMSALGADASAPGFYQRTKAEGEALVHASGLQATSFRPSIIYGPGDSFFNRFAALLRRSPWVFPLACAQSRLQPVYVGDVVDAFACALERHATFGQHYNLCGPRVYTLQELVEYTAWLLRRRRRVIPLGPRASRWQARVAEYLPGKPFSMDNLRSLQIDNVCHGRWPAIFDWRPAAIEETVPAWLGAR